MKLPLLLFSLFIAINLQAQVGGDLDITYGNNGIAEYTLTINGVMHGITIYDTHQLNNGKLLAVGWAQSGCSSTKNNHGVILRLNTDGGLDPTFQNNGYGFYGTIGFSQIIPESNNSFYVVGSERIRKIDSDGNQDMTYGIGGTVTTVVEFNSIALNPDGTMILGGRTMNSAGKWELTVSKRFANGALDSNFGTNGFFKIPYVQLEGATLFDVRIDSANRILINGRKQRTQYDGNIFLARLTPGGILDASFGNNGEYVDLSHYDARAHEIYVESDGKILIAGNGQESMFGSQGMILSRLNPDGTLDTTYGIGGRMHHSIHSDSAPDRIHPFENGYAISGDAFNTVFVVRVNMDGTLNTTFNTTGFALLHTFDWTGFSLDSTIEGNRMIISANSMFADCAQSKYKAQFIRVFLNDEGLTVTAFQPNDMEICDDDNDGLAVFDLTQNDSIILNGQPNVTVTYHITQADAMQGVSPIPNPQTYSNIVPFHQTIYARAQGTGMGNYEVVSFNLIVNDSPDLPTSVSNIVQCGNSVFDLTVRDSEIIGYLLPSNYILGYFISENDAVSNNNGIIDPNIYQIISNTQTIYARLTNLVTGCFDTTYFEIINGEADISVAPIDLFETGKTPGYAIFDLTQNTSLVLNGDDPSEFEVAYFETQTDAQQNMNAIATPKAYANKTNPQSIYVRKTDLNSQCFATSQFSIEADATVGIADKELESLKMFPNPVVNELNIGSSTFSWEVTATIYSIDGKVINSLKIFPMDGKFSIDVSTISQGVYILQISTNGQMLNKHFIKR